MYAEHSPILSVISRPASILATLGLSCLLSVVGQFALAGPPVIRHITQATERLELTVNSSRILTLDKRIPKMVVNNPELVTVTAISANQVQLAARKPGVTQVNLWDEDDQVYTVDVMIYGDVRELEHALKRLFPESSVKVVRLTNSLVLEGFVERPEAVSPIMRLAEDYAPKVINNITVGGVQQVLLHVKVMEVSRTKLRRLGVDFAQFSGDNIAVSSISGLIQSLDFAPSSVTQQIGTFSFGVVDGNDAFLGMLDALQENQVAKILADPTITAVSGRPAHFNVGGELPIIIPSGLGQTSVEFKKFGTQVDFLPIVLGNGNIRLEVRPRVSEIDDTRGVNIGQFQVPAFKVREVDTGVELKAGQTLALAGLVQTRIEATERGLPWVSDLPYIGAAFRRIEEEVNEIELLILVTPEFVDGMAQHEVPPCGPGMESVSPSNRQLYFGGHLEMPSCGPCGPGNSGGCSTGCTTGCDSGYGVATSTDLGPAPSPAYGQGTAPLEVHPNYNHLPSDAGSPQLNTPSSPTPVTEPIGPGINTVPAEADAKDPTALRQTPPWMANQMRNRMPAPFSRDDPAYRTSNQPPSATTTTPGLIGPIGYDVGK